MPKKVFLIDGIGAIISAFMLGFVFVKIQHYIGIPKNILYFLAIIPCFLALYSFGCYYFFPKKWNLYLKIIAVLNLLYCFLTTSLLIILIEKTTFLGVAYFIIEIVILVTLIIFELKIARTKTN